jgi:hypothetical protein
LGILAQSSAATAVLPAPVAAMTRLQ